MIIERINSYQDTRFSQTALNQHGCFLVDGIPCEVQIIGRREAVISGQCRDAFREIIDEFRFYAPHITVFYDENHRIIRRFPSEEFVKIPLSDIQPSQFYVDLDKITAIRDFIRNEEDIIIQVLPFGDRFISLDGHTRLYYAVTMGWKEVYAVIETSADYALSFAAEAIARSIHTPYDLIPVCHDEYEIKWNQFCDDFFAGKGET